MIMDLQLHDGGNYTMPRRKFTTASQIMKRAYGTPTYFQFLDEMGLSGDEDDNTLEFNVREFIERKKAEIQAQQAAMEPKPTPVVMLPSPTPSAPLVMLPTPTVNPNQVYVDAGKRVGGAILQTITQPGGSKPGDVTKNIITTGAGLIPGGNLLIGGIDALTGGIFSGGGKGKPFETLSPEEQQQKIKTFENLLAKNPPPVVAKPMQKFLDSMRQKAAQQPIVAAEPTNIPMVGKTAAGLAPIMPQLEPAKTGFGGLSTTNLILLGLGGFLAFKLLNK
jgi:hypothetical protein